MLEILDFIAERGGNPDLIRESQKKRGDPVEVVDQVIELFQEQRKANYDLSIYNGKINAVQKQIGLKKRAKEDATELLAEKAKLEEEKKQQDALAKEKTAAMVSLAKTVGNYVHESVPVSDNEDNNEIVRTFEAEGFSREKKEGARSHYDVLELLNGYDPARGAKLAGHRGYVLLGYGVLLNQALINYGIEFLFQRGYTPNQPPFFLNRDQMAKTAQLSQFDEELYHVRESASDKPENTKYLIATSEQPISCMFSEEWLQASELPIRYCGYSTCFRKEAGSHGRDESGIFRIHQFEKVEQFVICKPEDSWRHFDEMIATSEEFYKSLGLSYRVVSIVSGALNNAAAKKLDLEAWFPTQQDYKELVSCSNCTSYQTRELEIRYGFKKGGTADKGKGAAAAEAERKEYVHALNATLCATQRTLCCVLETHQSADGKGFDVPEVLRKYIPGQPTFLPFTFKEAVEAKAKVEGKGKGGGGKKDVAVPVR